MLFHTFGFIGLGLIGGSIARAIRNTNADAKIIAYDPDQTSLKEALHDHVLTQAADAIDETFADCDVIFLCAPVAHNDENLPAVKKILSPAAILTDIGSVKTDIHQHIRAAGLQEFFIGGHPMAGSERTGYRNSRAKLLENAYYILAPEPEVSPQKAASFTAFIASLGAIPLILDCQKHDYATAAVSHVPHVVSASLVNLIKDSDDPQGIMKMIAAGGFKDITRISSSSAVMWQQICLTNKENILSLLDDYIESLQKIRSAIADGDSDRIYQFFDNARIYREGFAENRSGALPSVFALYVDIPDRPGVIAEIVNLLAQAEINIKNIGIQHNREYQEGVLRIELHTEDGLCRARELLSENGYMLH